MTEERKGVSAWLRGIVDESCGKENIPLCTEITETFFGIKCREMHTCGSCILTMLTAIAYRIDAEMVEKGRLKKENAELKAELADWKGNAEGFQPDAYMKLPLDADGEPIRIGDEVNIDGDAMTVLGYRLHNDMLLLVAKDKKSGLFFTPEPSIVRHFKPEPADSWEKLEEDARKTACDYAPAPRDEDGLTTCDGCRFQKSESCSNEMTLDVVERAKKLAGIEEEARND